MDIFDSCSTFHCFEFHIVTVKLKEAYVEISWILVHSWFNCIYEAKSARKTSFKWTFLKCMSYPQPFSFIIIARAVILNLTDCFVDGCVDCRQVLFCADCWWAAPEVQMALLCEFRVSYDVQICCVTNPFYCFHSNGQWRKWAWAGGHPAWLR